MGKKSFFGLPRQFRDDDGASYPSDPAFLVRGVLKVTIQAAAIALEKLSPVLLETLLVLGHTASQRKRLHDLGDVFEKGAPILYQNKDITKDYTDKKGHTWKSITEKPRLNVWQEDGDEKKRTYYDAERHPAMLLDELAGELVMGPSWPRHHYEHSLSIPLLDNPVEDMRYRTSFSSISVRVPRGF
jgi:hypothetical protein